jgi:hypothetical protein
MSPARESVSTKYTVVWAIVSARKWGGSSNGTYDEANDASNVLHGDRSSSGKDREAYHPLV